MFTLKSSRNTGLVVAFYFLILTNIFADPIDSYWQQKVDYDMDIVLHDSIRQIKDKSTIMYANSLLGLIKDY